MKTEVWNAVSVYVPFAIIEKELGLDGEPHTLLQILSIAHPTQSSRGIRPPVPQTYGPMDKARRSLDA